MDHYDLEHSDPALLSWSTRYTFMLQQALAIINQAKPSPGLPSVPLACIVVETELGCCSDDRFNQSVVPLYSEASFATGEWLSLVGAMMGQAGFLRATAALGALLDDTPRGAWPCRTGATPSRASIAGSGPGRWFAACLGGCVRATDRLPRAERGWCVWCDARA